MKFSNTKLSEHMANKPALIGGLPDLAKLPRNRLNLLGVGVSNRLGHVLSRWLDRHFDMDGELSGPRLMLILVLAKHRQMPMSTAAELLDVTPRAITRLVDGLEAEGFARRQPNEADKRVVMVVITDRGDAVAKRLVPAHEAGAAKVFGIFTDEELRTYLELSHRLLQRIREINQDAK